MKLLKQDVINRLAEKTGLYKKDVRAVLDSFNELIYEEMDANNSIIIATLFKIEPITVDARQRYSPFVDCKYYIGEGHKNVKVTISPTLADSIRKTDSDNLTGNTKHE